MSHNGPLALYRSKVARGELRADTAQELAAEKLESLYHRLKGWRPPAPVAAPAASGGWKARLGLGGSRSKPAAATVAPQPPAGTPPGLYIFGEVGRGKSMLMDLFFATAPVQEKRRVHFHEFMRDFHAEMHRWRQGKGKDDADPIPPLAQKIVASSWLLCLDELEIHDITDAMVVGRIFRELFAAGAVIVTTSNRAPRDLYKDGLQRDRFLPFIALIEQHLDLLELASLSDYRLGRIKGSPTCLTPLGPDTDRQLEEIFARLTAGRTVKPDVMLVNGREVPVPAAAGDVARFAFEDLCGQPLGPGDYLNLATLYDVVVLTGVPVLGPENKDKARRFVTLVDALYDHRTMLVLTAAAPPERLYPEGQGAFEFQRTVSRLTEMQAEDYLGARHLT